MIETFSHPHLENCSSTIIMRRVKTKQNKTEMNKTQKKLWKSAQMVAWISTYIPYFFNYKPSDSFSIWHKGLGDFFTRNGVRLIAEGLGLKKKYKFTFKCKMTINSVTAALFFFFCVYSHSLAVVLIEPFPNFFH